MPRCSSGIAQVRPLPPLTADAGAPAPDAPGPTAASADVAGVESDDVAGVESDDVEPDAGGSVVPIRRRPRTAWFAAAAAAAVIAVGGLAWSPWSDDAGTQSPMDQVAAAADAQRVTSSKGSLTAEVAYSSSSARRRSPSPACRPHRTARPTSSGTSAPTRWPARPGC